MTPAADPRAAGLGYDTLRRQWGLGRRARQAPEHEATRARWRALQVARPPLVDWRPPRPSPLARLIRRLIPWL